MTASGLGKNKPARKGPWRYDGGELMLTLRIQAGAERTEMAGRYGETALRLRLAAPAREGQANKACVRFLAKALGVPARAVTILHGESSRDKVLRITEVSQHRCKLLLTQWGS